MERGLHPAPSTHRTQRDQGEERRSSAQGLILGKRLLGSYEDAARLSYELGTGQTRMEMGAARPGSRVGIDSGSCDDVKRPA